MRKTLTALVSLFGFGLIAGCAAAPKSPTEPNRASDREAVSAPADLAPAESAPGDMRLRAEPAPALAEEARSLAGAGAGAADMTVDDDFEAEAAPAAPAAPPPPPGSLSKKRVDRVAPAPTRAGRAAKRPPSRPRPATIARARGVKAGEWDDNANYREFQKWIDTQARLPIEQVDVSQRRFIVVRDDNGEGVPNCRVIVRDNSQHNVTLTTTSSGRALLFPHAEGLRGSALRATSTCLGQTKTVDFHLQNDDGLVDIKLNQDRGIGQSRVIDVAFVLDTTGSMSEEIAAVKRTIQKVASDLQERNLNVRIALVEYRDKGDAFVTRVHQMSSNVHGFSRRVASIHADGGGDTPEHANEGLRVALEQLDWSEQSVARMAFVIADAPPHLDYNDDVSYAQSMKAANHRGIQLFTVAASGMNGVGQAVWRQIAAYTGGTNMFVMRGGAGPQSVGGGDPKSSCGGTHKNFSSGNLDQLITDKIRLQVKLLDVNPMLIPGLGQDERAKPCEDRLVIAM